MTWRTKVASGEVTEDGVEDRWTMRLGEDQTRERKVGGARADGVCSIDEYLDLMEKQIVGKKYLKDWHFVHAFGHDIYEYD